MVIFVSIFRAAQNTFGNDRPGIGMADDTAIFAAAFVVVGQGIILGGIVLPVGDFFLDTFALIC